MLALSRSSQLETDAHATGRWACMSREGSTRVQGAERETILPQVWVVLQS